MKISLHGRYGLGRGIGRLGSGSKGFGFRLIGFKSDFGFRIDGLGFTVLDWRFSVCGQRLQRCSLTGFL